MNLTAFTRTVKDILDVNKKYIVPRFQRPFSWDIEEHQEFLNDIIKYTSQDKGNLLASEYFIGSIVLVGSDDGDEFEIVDGQQRLTTISIIFSVLTHIFDSLEEKKLADSCYNYVEGKDKNYESFFKLQNETPKPFFQKRIQYKENKEELKPSSDEETLLLKSYEFYYDELSKENLCNRFGKSHDYIEMLKTIRDQLLKLKTIFITVESISDAYTIFETLNAKGKNLDTIDLVKNKIFEKIKDTHPSDNAKEIWKNIYKNIDKTDGNNNVERFFRYFWLSRYSFATSKNLYSEFKGRIKIDEYEKFLKDLNMASEDYHNIMFPQTNVFQNYRKHIFDSLIALKYFNVSQTNILLLALFKANREKIVTEKEFFIIIDMIEKFHFIYTAVTSSNPSGIEGKYSTLGRKLLSIKPNNKKEVGLVIKELKDYYKTKLPKESEFIEEFNKLEYRRNNHKRARLIKYIFMKIEKSNHSTNELVLDIESITLEHILSQSTTKNNIGLIGNLLPLCSSINGKAKDYTLDKKIKFYSESQILEVKNFVKINKDKREWTEDDINNRTNDIAKMSYNEIWKL